MLLLFKRAIRNYSQVPIYPKAKVSRQSTLRTLYSKYQDRKPISVITAHDYISGKYANESEADAVIIGDSLSMINLGYQSTLEMSFEEFYYCCKAACRAIDRKFIIADLPFGTFETSAEECGRNAIKLMKLGKVQSIKLEGSYEITDQVKKLIDIGIPVTGHVGLQPQKFNALGGYRVQGKTATDAIEIFRQAKYLQSLGVSLLVLEAIPSEVAKIITEELNLPTIGIGAGKYTSGQVLVQGDVLGMLNNKPAKFVRQYKNFYQEGIDGINEYCRELNSDIYPEEGTHTYSMAQEEVKDLIERIRSEK
ncbi:3-methyl-2-oxobutanoate hydroxymethyltransferase [Komagataella phaffii CBS 7435]|uniref:3-methyl-2-oxobutanoate hydroxymethyltransferase n=2 Tax=Komagataella phaffii TaxID=460519 RepID=C4R687_KOMPG|nr:Ketopantoate hydroxymethyltransferase, required for pantothenic acid biosynthesis [Komagataella phaffii GS115]AOA63586.1 GQ67_04142T0 [Komagataella phaffii]CAH2449088.1 3-methyl-2-oxobutanoate hydroxymethyltransferase [Komagataella phaffii CBS 7435]AOA68268.1 GQ68_04115T0 [Komagataella phaffii GS115]CAY71073.1 Ketopantoate hydroxymethyltransferase, required for pantothenic acid biosynthesis [Komagataella phaffii GS115]CCA39130.1 3-methyl-2-oxobutanoate hydroxymethyltransferase [Komagataella